MPRAATCRSSDRVGNGNETTTTTKNQTANTEYKAATTTSAENTKAATTTTQTNNIKIEYNGPAPTEVPQVVHRKSERRRVARDIFLVFEEQPARRRGRGTKGKPNRAKRKFGHLKVQNPKPSKCLLREIKTEPKCPINIATILTVAAETVTEAEATAPLEIAAASAVSPTATTIETVEPPEVSLTPPKEPLCVTAHGKSAKSTTIKIETKIASNATQTAALLAQNSTTEMMVEATPPSPPTTPTTPSVNPIFLWVKQDDTRIVEVRCEDYDKRNRIRLTKTTNGWRSMPRTDASSTRIVKFFQNSTAPLLKVKHEVYENQQLQLQLQEQEHQVMQQQHQQQQQQHHQHQQQQHHEQTELDALSTQISVSTSEAMLPELAPQLPTPVTEKIMQEWHEDTTLPLSNQANLMDYAPPEIVDDVLVMPAMQVITPQLDEQAQEATLTTACFDVLMETNELTKAATTTPTYQNSATITIATADAATTPTPSTTTTATIAVTPMELQLCPKTGLFLPKGTPDTESDIPTSSPNDETLDKDMLTSIENATNEKTNPTSEHAVDHTESLDANTKNLKDLLDDADLLQNCSSDNGSNGVELLDSLVKRSCEDNLMHDNISTATTPATMTATDALIKDALSLNSFCVSDLNELTQKDLPPIMDIVDDAPKCLSFNEAGEIEGLNGELFQSNNFIDSFGKESCTINAATGGNVEPQQTNDKLDETPKDLSYKKREEVCPPSESRSQCAVTSSSDILKSPNHEAGNITAEVETTSETIKNLILEQFIKLNALNQLPGMPVVANNQQAEPMDLGKSCIDKQMPTTPQMPTTRMVGNNYLETVVIDDEEEPLKKRHCGATKANIKLDKDPDPLTQLKMLINNSQWKVPDPILVPKDRLGAVLASPAREIPLLLTTRPELRLPEAFAYPEIIQNPNILVISMAQLEAILKNDVEPTPIGKQMTEELHELNHKLLSPKETHKTTHVKTTSPLPLKEQPLSNSKCAHATVPQADSSLATDINAATLAVLQQMLWLPYFGQLSQEFFKTLKGPLGLQRKFPNNLMPFYNNQFGLQHLDELYKHYVKQMSATKANVEEPAATVAAVPQQAPPPTLPAAKLHVTPPPPPTAAMPVTAAAVPLLPQPQPNFSAFTNPLELAFFQKLFQPQMPNFLSLNAAQATAATGKCESQSPLPGVVKHAHAVQQLEQKRARRPASNSLDTHNTSDFNNSFNALDKAHSQQQAPPTGVAAATAATTTTAATPQSSQPAASKVTQEKKQTTTPPNVEHKPRLTCKSLSNLLDPENINAAAVTVPLLNVPFDGLRRAAQAKQQTTTKDNIDCNTISNSNTRTLRSSKACVTYNALELAKQQRKRNNLHDPHADAAFANAAINNNAIVDANAALWHPLFGSNPKQGYNSPWQWTTVTATGE